MNKIISLLLTLILFSCKTYIEPELPEDLFEKYNGSVVLIANQYYYEILTHETVFYYSPSSQNKIFMSKNEVLQNLSFSTGTGFIISKEGEIITNRHVVNPYDNNFKSEMSKFNQQNIGFIAEKTQKYSDSIEALKNYYYNNEYLLTELQKEQFEIKYDQLNEQKEFSLNSIYFLENLDFSDAKLKLVTVNIGIAFNDTYVTEFNDLQECIVVKQSDKEEVDLALIQTKTKTFNKPPIEIFNFEDNNPNILENPSENKERDIKNPIKINSDVYMIGFNRGFILANTKQGIKSQFTVGKISQENDNERILYTIPTLEGSSGSPILDKWGNLVAVNFAKLSDSQNFSFGIPVYEVQKFYEE